MIHNTKPQELCFKKSTTKLFLGKNIALCITASILHNEKIKQSWKSS